MAVPPSSRLPKRGVCPWILRERFQQGRFLERVEAGELLEEWEEGGTPSEEAHQPAGTKSQMGAYRTRQGVVVAKVHRYLLPDGGIGASGRPDPKWLLVDNEIWNQGHKETEACPECLNRVWRHEAGPG